MKSIDLMIGDWVYVAHRGSASHFGKVSALLSSGAVETEIEGSLALSSSVKPIPLTAEILEKNGFKKAGFNDNWPSGLCGKWWSKDGQIVVKMFELTLMGIVFSVSGSNSKISNIRYVHDLQHALRLCGIEREIKP